jgi:hypothetical protein
VQGIGRNLVEELRVDPLDDGDRTRSESRTRTSDTEQSGAGVHGVDLASE